MKYRAYLSNVSFEEVWLHIARIYKEGKSIRPSYEMLYNSVILLPVHETQEIITIKKDQFKRIKVLNTLDPQEELIDREVVFDNQVGSISNAEVAAHLLYWSSMYGFKTAKQHHENFGNWLNEISQGPYYGENGKICKYIYLDFDGVLNTEQYQAELAVVGVSGKDKYGPLFDPETVRQLNRLVETTGAEIIVTSSWRYVYEEDTLYEMWADRGLPDTRVVILDRKFKGISKNKHQKYVPYVYIDDKDKCNNSEREFLIQTNPEKGLLAADVDRAIAILNRFDNYTYHDFHPDDTPKNRAKARRQAQIESRSLDRKRLRYWQDTIMTDSAIDWSWNLWILKKKLEYNIGYWRYMQRHVGWEEDVRRMQLACSLINIVTDDYVEMNGAYVNAANAKRFYKDNYDLNDTEYREYYLQKIRQAKAYDILWRFLNKNMKKWWD